MMEDYSSQAFFEFLDYLSKKGLMKKPTIAARRAASKAILDILDEDDTADLRRIDVDRVVNRFANLKGNGFTPGSLNTYKSRFSSALNDFLSYKANPLGFTPGVSPRKPRSQREKHTTHHSTEKAINTPPTPAQQPQESIVFPIPLRPGVVVQVAGIPSDLTHEEAKKITAVIAALGTSSESGG